MAGLGQRAQLLSQLTLQRGGGHPTNKKEWLEAWKALRTRPGQVVKTLRAILNPLGARDARMDDLLLARFQQETGQRIWCVYLCVY